MSLTDDEYWNLGSNQVEDLVRRVNRLVATFPEPRRSEVKKMLDGPIGQQFMIAPASTRRAFHNAFPCGLALHSLNVADRAFEIANTLAPGRWPDWKLGFVGLFHDLGKAGHIGHPYYVQSKRQGWLYEMARDGEFIPASERSLFILQDAGIKLDYEEMGAIRLADGPAPDGNSDWRFNEPDLALILHWADWWEMRIEKKLGQ